MTDIWAGLSSADHATLERLAETLELGAAGAQQRAMLEDYLAHIPFRNRARVLEVGCGTGAIARVLARWSNVGDLVGLDRRPYLKNPSRPMKRVFLPGGQADLPGALLLWAKECSLADDQPLFFSRKRAAQGALRPISRQQAWEIVRAASERANVRVLALRPSAYGAVGEPAPVHPHLFRHARVRQIVRTTKSLPIAQKQAGWSRLQMSYLTVGDEEVRAAMQLVAE